MNEKREKIKKDKKTETVEDKIMTLLIERTAEVNKRLKELKGWKEECELCGGNMIRNHGYYVCEKCDAVIEAWDA
jgi:hypothetical protein